MLSFKTFNNHPLIHHTPKQNKKPSSFFFFFFYGKNNDPVTIIYLFKKVTFTVNHTIPFKYNHFTKEENKFSSSFKKGHPYLERLKSIFQFDFSIITLCLPPLLISEKVSLDNWQHIIFKISTSYFFIEFLVETSKKNKDTFILLRLNALNTIFNTLPVVVFSLTPSGFVHSCFT